VDATNPYVVLPSIGEPMSNVVVFGPTLKDTLLILFRYFALPMKKTT
jgi:hypothetical protein